MEEGDPIRSLVPILAAMRFLGRAGRGRRHKRQLAGNGLCWAARDYAIWFICSSMRLWSQRRAR